MNKSNYGIVGRSDRLILRETNCKVSITGFVDALILGSMALSKHFANIEVRVTGRRALLTFGSGFLFTGTISPIFHRAGILHRERQLPSYLWYNGSIFASSCFYFYFTGDIVLCLSLPSSAKVKKRGEIFMKLAPEQYRSLDP